jgi:hypothetical protein
MCNACKASHHNNNNNNRDILQWFVETASNTKRWMHAAAVRRRGVDDALMHSASINVNAFEATWYTLSDVTRYVASQAAGYGPQFLLYETFNASFTFSTVDLAPLWTESMLERTRMYWQWTSDTMLSLALPGEWELNSFVAGQTQQRE